MINSTIRRMTELYSHPNNANRFAWFTESFIDAFLLHPDSKAIVTEIMTKFNQQLEQPLTKSEQQAVYERLMRRLRYEL